MKSVFAKIIERLEELKKKEADIPSECDENGFGDGEQLYNDGRNQGRYEQAVRIIEIVNQVAEEYGDGWIPVSSGKLPKDGVDVLVWFEYFRYGEYNRLFQTQGISYTYNGEWSGFVNGSSGWRELRIIAWQPLPEPYRSKETEV